jgi:hypothetical protein
MSTGEIRVRAFQEGDVEAFIRIHSQPSVAAMTLQVPYQQVSEMQQRLAFQPQQRNLVAETGD